MADDPMMEANDTPSAKKASKPVFYGSFEHSVDPKGRLIIPATYRKNLGSTFVISITRDGKGIGLYPNEVFDELFSDVFSLNQRRSAVVAYRNIMAKFSFPESAVDSQGRVLLPAKLRSTLLDDATEVEISGAIDHIRIVSSQMAQQEEMDFFQNRENILEEIAGMLDQLNQ